MKRALGLLLAAPLLTGFLAGCEPAPSTPLAPDQKPPDLSKVSSADIDRMVKQNASGPGRPR